MKVKLFEYMLVSFRAVNNGFPKYPLNMRFKEQMLYVFLRWKMDMKRWYWLGCVHFFFRRSEPGFSYPVELFDGVFFYNDRKTKKNLENFIFIQRTVFMDVSRKPVFIKIKAVFFERYRVAQLFSQINCKNLLCIKNPIPSESAK